MRQLVELLVERGYKVWMFGSGQEAKELEEWAKDKEQVELLAGKLSFQEELEHIATLDVMVSMDSANMHFASCMGVPVVSIWGATHPCRGFYGWRQNPAWAVQADMDCRPCSKYGSKPCKYGDYRCMQSIGLEDVLGKVEALLGST